MNSTILAMLAITQAALSFDQYRHYFDLALTAEQVFRGEQ